ncbi:MAG: DegT/DnrJ/EryC1/StrS aminotransferase family protein [Chlamydiia bacterium]|nr:DegT/DnrJ/EryC1/StrS aminotransferase family protein [Chlamydiia bacterium]
MSAHTFFPYAKQSIDASDIEAVQEALQQEKITRGDKTTLFEEAVAEFVDAKWAVSFNSASTALYAAMFAASASPADRFITSPNTFIASAAAGMRLDIKPHFIDIDRTSGNLNLKSEELKETLNNLPSRGKLIILPVHFAGQAIDMKKLERLIATPNAVVIEDAAHALGSLYPTGEKVGSCTYSQMTVFSFHPAKNITTGEGGMVTTNDETLYHRLLLFRNNGIERGKPYLLESPAPGYYEVHELSGNYHITEMQAALGLSQMKRLQTFVDKRRALVTHYYKNLEGKPHITLFAPHHQETTAYHIMCLQINFSAYNTTRKEVMEKLRSKGIGSDVHYIPIYKLPVFTKKYGDISSNYPETEAYYNETLTLPLYTDLTEVNVDYITTTLLSILEENQKG